MVVGRVCILVVCLLVLSGCTFALPAALPCIQSPTIDRPPVCWGGECPRESKWGHST